MQWKMMMIAASLSVACVQDVGKGKVAADVAETPAGEAVQAVAASKTLRVDTTKSKLHALGAKITAKHPIVFHEYEGKVGLGADGEVVSVSFVAQVASLESDAERLTAHLKNEDFFWVEKYPTAIFESVSVTQGGEGGTHTITGDLTIRGQTKRLTFPATVGIGQDGVTASTEFVIDRKDFGVVYAGKADDLIQDNVVLTIQFVAPNAAS